MAGTTTIPIVTTAADTLGAGCAVSQDLNLMTFLVLSRSRDFTWIGIDVEIVVRRLQHTL